MAGMLAGQGTVGAMAEPDRWLHLRHPEGFTDHDAALFAAGCRIWWAHVQAVLAEWALLEPGHATVPHYVVFDPVHEGTRLTLPLGGSSTLASRARFEDAASHLLSDAFPPLRRLHMEEGLTETLDRSVGPRTHWRPVLRAAR